MPREHQESEHAMQHWTLTRDADGLARLTLDRAGGSTNTLGAPVLAELNAALDELDRNPPRGLIIASGKANGFIAGADVDEFTSSRTKPVRLHSSSGAGTRSSDSPPSSIRP